MANQNRRLTLEESFDELDLSEWADRALTGDQMFRLQELLDEADGRRLTSQARFLFELTRLAQATEPELARILAERALESAEDPSAWIESDSDGLMSRYWGYEAFLETCTELRVGSAEERQRYFDIAQRQVDLAAEAADSLRQRGLGPSGYHEHAGYYYLAERAANEGNNQQALALVRRARDEGWAGPWNKLEHRYAD